MTEDAPPATAESQPDPKNKVPKLHELMSPPVGVFHAEMTVSETVEQLREMTRSAFITYCYVTDAEGRLEGLVVMRDMLLAKPGATLGELMLKAPFSLKEDMPLADALKAALAKHFPVYPVTDAGGVLKGLIRGDTLFAEQAIEISAQAGSMVGVEKEERLATPIQRSLKLRHPWLQINLLTAFLAAAVVGCFEDTLSKVVILAVFLPVMAGQSGNTGCQALAVALRGMTLGDVKAGQEKRLIFKEGTLGFFNGLFVGLTAGLGMVVYAMMQNQEKPWLMGFIVMVAMIASCVISGLSGALIPLALKRLGADPATASSIFLTTATDIASMGVFLSLATWLLI
ncbi:MAG: Magnesium transporter MgtE [Verrucomicrobiota bacterium]|jgi:magnesium transporter